MVLLVVLLSPSFTRLVICRPRVPENTRPHTSPSRASSRGQSLQTVRGARAAYCSSCCPVGRAATRRPLRGPARATHDPSTTRSPRAASPRPVRASASSRGGAATRPRTLRLAARRRRDPSARQHRAAAPRPVRASTSGGVAATRPRTLRLAARRRHDPSGGPPRRRDPSAGPPSRGAASPRPVRGPSPGRRRRDPATDLRLMRRRRDPSVDVPRMRCGFSRRPGRKSSPAWRPPPSGGRCGARRQSCDTAARRGSFGCEPRCWGEWADPSRTEPPPSFSVRRCVQSSRRTWVVTIGRGEGPLVPGLVAAASPRLVSIEYPRRDRGVAAIRLHGLSTSRPPRLVSTDYPRRGRRDSSPRTIHVAARAPPRLVSTDYPRRGRGADATRPHGISMSRPRRRRESSPWKYSSARIRRRGFALSTCPCGRRPRG